MEPKLEELLGKKSKSIKATETFMAELSTYLNENALDEDAKRYIYEGYTYQSLGCLSEYLARSRETANKDLSELITYALEQPQKATTFKFLLNVLGLVFNEFSGEGEILGLLMTEIPPLSLKTDGSRLRDFERYIEQNFFSKLPPDLDTDLLAEPKQSLTEFRQFLEEAKEFSSNTPTSKKLEKWLSSLIEKQSSEFDRDDDEDDIEYVEKKEEDVFLSEDISTSEPKDEEPVITWIEDSESVSTRKNEEVLDDEPYITFVDHKEVSELEVELSKLEEESSQEDKRYSEDLRPKLNESSISLANETYLWREAFKNLYETLHELEKSYSNLTIRISGLEQVPGGSDHNHARNLTEETVKLNSIIMRQQTEIARLNNRISDISSDRIENLNRVICSQQSEIEKLLESTNHEKIETLEQALDKVSEELFGYKRDSDLVTKNRTKFYEDQLNKLSTELRKIYQDVLNVGPSSEPKEYYAMELMNIFEVLESCGIPLGTKN